jgi:integrase-like protein
VIGVTPADLTLHAALRRGQRPTTELVDDYDIRCRPLRDVLVRYLDERRPMFISEDIRIVRTPVRPPRANAIAERWIGTVRRELPDQMLIVNRRHLETVLAQYVTHFNDHRPHRTLNQAAPLHPLPPPTSPSQRRVQRRDRLGGLIHEYTQVA